MKKLAYTKDMEKQDGLYFQEEEDHQEMEKHFKRIISEAEEKGFEGVHLIWSHDEPKTAIAEIYRNETEREGVIAGTIELDEKQYHATCKSLISYLEKLMEEK